MFTSGHMFTDILVQLIVDCRIYLFFGSLAFLSVKREYGAQGDGGHEVGRELEAFLELLRGAVIGLVILHQSSEQLDLVIEDLYKPSLSILAAIGDYLVAGDGTGEFPGFYQYLRLSEKL